MKAAIIFIVSLWFFPLSGVGLAADLGVFSVSATILSKSNCKFNSSAATLNFGSLDPVNPIPVTATTTLPFVCHGSANPATFQITDNDGLYATGANANRMRNLTVTTQYIPYQLSYSPSSASVPKGVDQTLTITGTIAASGYKTAMAGTYQDTVVLTITP